MQKKILLILISFLLISCDEKFNGSEESLVKMMEDLSPKEQILFIKKFELVSTVYGGESKLQGWTVEDINKESLKVIKFIKKKNKDFLENYIIYMKKNGMTSSYLHRSKEGFMSKPKTGFLYKKEYSLQELEKALSNLKQEVE